MAIHDALLFGTRADDLRQVETRDIRVACCAFVAIIA
jgi:hypothetical protein